MFFGAVPSVCTRVCTSLIETANAVPWAFVVHDLRVRPSHVAHDQRANLHLGTVTVVDQASAEPTATIDEKADDRGYSHHW